MKFFLSTISVVVLSVLAFADEQPQIKIVVSYPKDTPTNVVEEAKAAVLEAGGFISHEYHTVVLGFAATTPPEIVDTIQAAGLEHDVLIEEDKEVSINGS